MQDNPNEIAVKKGELEKLTPLSSEDMKKLIPETLLGFKRTSYSANNYTGLNMVSGDYEGENHQRIYLHIDDCSGLLGAELYEAHFSALANKDQESEGSYSKIIDYRNGKAMEYLDKRYNDCRLTWIAGGRFLVILDGKVIGAEKTKQAGLELKF